MIGALIFAAALTTSGQLGIVFPKPPRVMLVCACWERDTTRLWYKPNGGAWGMSKTRPRCWGGKWTCMRRPL